MLVFTHALDLWRGHQRKVSRGHNRLERSPCAPSHHRSLNSPVVGRNLSMREAQAYHICYRLRQLFLLHLKLLQHQLWGEQRHKNEGTAYKVKHSHHLPRNSTSGCVSKRFNNTTRGDLSIPMFTTGIVTIGRSGNSWGLSCMIKCLPKLHRALNSVPSAEKKKKKNIYIYI
jgi:hypothetical protein